MKIQSPSSSALIVIDVQKGIDNSDHWGGNRNNPDAEGNIKLLLSTWLSKAMPVIIIQHSSLEKDSPFYPGQLGHDLKDFVQQPGNVLIKKTFPSAFSSTSLELTLRELEVTTLYLVGFVTNNSVESTARAASGLGFNAIVVGDATAAFNKQGLDGTVYSSELIHQISLANLNGEYATIRSAREVINDLN